MGSVIAKTCKNCGRPFLTRDKNKEFCDIKCEEDHRDGIVVKPRANEFVADTKVCKNCGKTFHRRYCEGLEVFEKRKYCCLSCANSGANKRKANHVKKNSKKRITVSHAKQGV